jgi:hypothetical protein
MLFWLYRFLWYCHAVPPLVVSPSPIWRRRFPCYRAVWDLAMAELQIIITLKNRVKFRRPNNEVLCLASLNAVFKIHIRLQPEACWGAVIRTFPWQLEVMMKQKNIFETGKWICAKLPWNTVDRSSSCGSNLLRYVGMFTAVSAWVREGSPVFFGVFVGGVSSPSRPNKGFPPKTRNLFRRSYI